MQLGMIGLGRMGGNIVRRLMRHGHAAVVYDKDPKAVAAIAADGALGSGELEEFVGKLEKPRTAWVMLPAGRITEATIDALARLMESGDVIIDGGNTFWQDDVRRGKALKERGIHYIDVGTSGGVWGIERGYCMMIGGDKAVVDRLDPIFAALAPGIGDIPRTEGREGRDPRIEQGYIHAGPVGAGHFVKMVHNGIEYGLMQAYAEGFDILKNANIEALPAEHRFDLDIADIAEVWRRGSVIPSWLLDLTASALAKNSRTGDLFRICRRFRRRPLDRQRRDRRSGPGRGPDRGIVRALSLAQGTHLCGKDPLCDACRLRWPQGTEKTRFEGLRQMTVTQAEQKKPDPCSIVIFGVTGDLAHRLVIPALYNLAVNELLPDNFCIVGIARKSMSSEELAGSLTKGLHQFATRKVDDAIATRLLRCVTCIEADPGNPASFDAMREQLDELEATRRTGGNRLFYLATPPNGFLPISNELGRTGMLTENGAWRRLVVEKPFGTDLASAKALNSELLKLVDEHQIYRIDHYLGKETVQNILVLRFANGMFEPIWNRNHIDHIQITVDEKLGVGHRGSFYDATGALRDMVPNHLFQLLSLVAMEPPAKFNAHAVRSEKAEVLAAIQTQSEEEALRNSVRGQYRAGKVGDTDIEDYRRTKNVNSNSTTETYAALKLTIDNWRWAGVPFYLRTGKALGVKRTEIAIKFKQAPFAMFRDTPVDRLSQNFLIISTEPTEGIALQFNTKVPGPAISIDGVEMKFRYKDYFQAEPSTGYETLIHDCMIGDNILFQRADSVEAGWQAVQPFLDAWNKAGAKGLKIYDPGSEGPEEANDLLERDGRSWRKLA